MMHDPQNGAINCFGCRGYIYIYIYIYIGMLHLLNIQGLEYSAEILFDFEIYTNHYVT